jgi:RimJ/RimL family protein N-acetyltransferase
MVSQIDAGRLVLRPIHRPVARMLLDGGTPRGLTFAPGYPSRFSLHVMELVVEAQEPGRFGPFFMVRKADGAIVGEIGCGVDDVSATGHVGYTVVQPCWGQGYAAEALRALLAHVLAEPGVDRVIAETTMEHTASRRVMEKAGMRHCGRRVDIEGGESTDLVVYEAVAGGAHRDAAGDCSTR